jgi:hypothetical protein
MLAVPPLVHGISAVRRPAEPTEEILLNYHAAIVRYYRAYRDRDRAALESLLTPDFHFVSSFGKYRDRDSMLDDIWPAVGQVWATNLQLFGQGPEFMVVYEHESASSLERPRTRMAEYLRFRGEMIAEVEVFVGRSLDSDGPA